MPLINAGKIRSDLQRLAWLRREWKMREFKCTLTFFFLYSQTTSLVSVPVSSCTQQSRGLLLPRKDGGTEKLLYLGTIATQGLLHQVLCQWLLLGHHRTPHLCQCWHRVCRRWVVGSYTLTTNNINKRFFWVGRKVIRQPSLLQFWKQQSVWNNDPVFQYYLIFCHFYQEMGAKLWK